MIWEPFVLALFLGLIVSAGLYFAYLWPAVEPGGPLEEPATAAGDSSSAPGSSEPEPEPEPEAKPAEAKPADASPAP